MKVSEILINAKALIDTPEKWIQGDLATDKDGGYAPMRSKEACKFCAMGAMKRVGDFTSTHDPEVVFRLAMQKKNFYTSIPTFNDNHTHEEVMEIFNDAIQIAKDKEAVNENRT